MKENKKTTSSHSDVSSEQWDTLEEVLNNPPEPTPLMKEIIQLADEDSWEVAINKE